MKLSIWIDPWRRHDIYSSVSKYLKKMASSFVFCLGPDKKTSCWFNKLVTEDLNSLIFSCKPFSQFESSHYSTVLPFHMQKIPQTDNLQIKTLQEQPLYLFVHWDLYLITQYSFKCSLSIAKVSPYTHLVLYLLTFLSSNSWLARGIRRLCHLFIAAQKRG